MIFPKPVFSGTGHSFRLEYRPHHFLLSFASLLSHLKQAHGTQKCTGLTRIDFISSLGVNKFKWTVKIVVTFASKILKCRVSFLGSFLSMGPLSWQTERNTFLLIFLFGNRGATASHKGFTRGTTTRGQLIKIQLLNFFSCQI